MKLNNGRGWDYKSYSSQAHLQNQHQSSSGRDHHARELRNSQRPGVTADRLNAAQPPPPSPAKGGAGKPRDRPSGSGLPPKRQSGNLETGTPAGSTQAQFQNSNAHLPGRMGSPGNQGVSSPQVGAPGNSDPQPTFVQKIMKALCCGR